VRARVRQRDEFLEGAKSAFSALMVRFPPEPKLVEQLREAIEPGLYKAMVEGGETYMKVCYLTHAPPHKHEQSLTLCLLMDACCTCACACVRVSRTRSE
jgi:hypothetical protein